MGHMRKVQLERDRDEKEMMIERETKTVPPNCLVSLVMIWCRNCFLSLLLLPFSYTGKIFLLLCPTFVFHFQPVNIFLTFLSRLHCPNLSHYSPHFVVFI